MISVAAASGPEVSLVAQKLFSIGPFPVTNSTVLGLLGTLILLGIMLYAAAQLRAKRTPRLAVAVLWVFDILYRTAEEVLGDAAAARRVAPLAITMFLLIMVNNWLGLLPLVGTVTYHGVPVLRGLAADLNFTLALAIITMVTAQVYAVRTHGFFGNLGRYFANPFTKPMQAFAGLLELVAEFSRLVALSMRLFGNVFGGEVLLAVIAFITAWLSPLSLPVFMLLELFVGAVQAYVFFMLTVVFVSLGMESHGESVHSEAPVLPASVPSTH